MKRKDLVALMAAIIYSQGGGADTAEAVDDAEKILSHIESKLQRIRRERWRHEIEEHDAAVERMRKEEAQAQS